MTAATDKNARTVGVGIIGLGTVGGGTARTILRHREEYLRAYGIDLRIARVCDMRPEREAELGLAPGTLTNDWHELVADPAVDIVVELIGGEHPATEIFEAAFAAGKHVVTANKALLGRHVEQLARLAAEHGVQLKCEAAAAGGIPIVNALEHALTGNEILTVAGILNGTTNYMLSRMETEGLDYDEVLADAQALGYAEADPSADVDGFDAASKVAILSSIAFHTRVTTDDVYMQGIRNVSAADIAQARELGYRVKLLGIARNTAGGVDVRVHPTMIPADHMLAGVSGAMNAVFVVGDAVGETMIIEERLLPAVVQGSCSIAYAMRYIGASVAGFVQLGFKAAAARNVVLQTVKGAVALLQTNGTLPEAEIYKVTTPGGYTIRGLNEMERAGFTNAVIRGLVDNK